MISSIPQSVPAVTVAVGQEVRVRESHGSERGESSRVIEKKTVNREGTQPFQESQKPEQVQEIISRLQETLQHVDPRIELSVDEELDQVIFRVVDKESGELIRQIPPEDVLDLERFFADHSGLFVKEEI